MALTALHEVWGRLDATLPDLGCGQEWGAIHRVRPRAPLACPECHHSVHPKISPHNLRFFAHDAERSECGLIGETMAHRLLKLELAVAARDAGFHAELEVRGSGGDWRADVLTTKPDGIWFMAWEAQLSSVTADELRVRTDKLYRSGVRVCWVVDRPRPWLGSVPSVLIQAPEAEGVRTLHVVGGLARFVDDDEESITTAGWREVQTNLRSFVRWVLTGRVQPFKPDRSEYLREHLWKYLWTAPRYAALATKAADAWRARECAARFEQERKHREVALKRRCHADPHNISKRLRRRLRGAVRRHIENEMGGGDIPVIEDEDFSDRAAGGMPVYVGGRLYGLLRPRPALVRWHLLEGVVIFTHTEAEAHKLARKAPPGTRIIPLEHLIATQTAERLPPRRPNDGDHSLTPL